MATLTAFLYAFLLLSNISLLANAQSISSRSYFPHLRPRASSTTSALDCTQTATGNISACYPKLDLIPACCRPCMVNVTLLQPCASTDDRCLCAHSTQIQLQALSCIDGTCPIEDEQTAVNYYYSYCNSMNYPLAAVPSSSSTPILATSTTTNPAPMTTPQSISSPSTTSLAPTAAAGIAISFAAILLIAGATLFFLHHRHRKASVHNRLPDDIANDIDTAALTRRDPAPPSYPTVQEIDGKTIVHIALHERLPDATIIADVSDSSNASTVYETIPPPAVVYEMDARRP